MRIYLRQLSGPQEMSSWAIFSWSNYLPVKTQFLRPAARDSSKQIDSIFNVDFRKCEQSGRSCRNRYLMTRSQSKGRAPSPLNPFASISLRAATLLGTLIPQQSPNISWTCTPSFSSSSPPIPNPSGGGIILPNKKCCITVRFPNTSPLNIFPNPSRTFDHDRTPEMSSSMGLCHLNPTVLTALICAMQPRYMYSLEK